MNLTFQIHQAMRDGNYDNVRSLVLSSNRGETPSSSSSVLWQGNTIGWTALHCCASHGVPHLGWWRWILGRALYELHWTQQSLSDRTSSTGANNNDNNSTNKEEQYDNGTHRLLEKDNLKSLTEAAPRLHLALDDREVLKFPGRTEEQSSFTKTMEKYCHNSDTLLSPTKTVLRLVSPFKEGECPSFTLTRTELGHSTVDLFFLRHLHPLEWQRPEVHQAATELKNAIQEVLDVSIQRNYLNIVREGISQRQELERKRQAEAIKAKNSENNNGWDDDFWMRPYNASNMKDEHPIIDRVVEFWHSMELLLMAAHLNTLDFCSIRFSPNDLIIQNDSQCPRQRQWRVVHALAKSNCPEEVARLAVALYPAQVKERDEEGLLPLHVAAASPSYTSTSIVDSDDTNASAPAMLKLLLQQYPQAAKCADRQGRLPLNVALACGKTWDTGVQILVQACPDILLSGTRDIPTRLFSFLMAAVVAEQGEQIIRSKRRASRSIGGMWRFLPPNAKERVLKEAQEEVEILQLNTVFELLRAMPEVVRSGITEDFNKYEIET